MTTHRNPTERREHATRIAAALHDLDAAGHVSGSYLRAALLTHLTLAQLKAIADSLTASATAALVAPTEGTPE